jgi:hypothetical protein
MPILFFELFQEHDFDGVIHLAAGISNRSITDPMAL